DDIREGGFRLFEEKEERAPEDVFEADTPSIVKDFLQSLDNPVCGKRAPERSDALQWIEHEGLIGVGHVQVNEIVLAGLRHPVVEALGKVAVRIEERESVSGKQVLPDHAFEEGRLAGAGFPDHVDV